MTFLHPLALLGLLLVPVLILLERWRRRPRERVWPSLLLWEGILETGEASARPRVDPLLLFECAAVTLLALAAAGPVIARATSARTVVVLRDRGPHMQARRADGTTVAEATARELARVHDALAPGDTVRTIDAAGDLARAAAGLPEADLRVVATDRPLEGPGLLVVGRAADGFNLAIDAVDVRGDRLWFAVATDRGPPRADVAVQVGGATMRVATGAGVETAFAETLRILTEDNYDGDDVVRLRRVELAAVDETGSLLVQAALYDAGTPARSATGGLRITRDGGAPLEGVIRGSDCVAAPGLFDGLALDGCRWLDVRARDGDGLLTFRGRALARWLDPDTLWLGLPVDREWDDHGTLAVLIERTKRAALRLGPGEARAGDAVAAPAPGLVDTRGVDRPWDRVLPAKPARRSPAVTGLRTLLALLAAGVLVLYLRAIVRRS